MHDMLLCCSWHELPAANHSLPRVQETISLSLFGMFPLLYTGPSRVGGVGRYLYTSSAGIPL